MPRVYRFQVPFWYKDFMDLFSVFSFQWLFGLFVAASCFGEGAQRLLIFSLTPLLLACLPPVSAVAFELAGRLIARVRSSTENEHIPRMKLGKVFLRATPLSLFITFICCIEVSNEVFLVWDCEYVVTDSVSSPTSRLYFHVLDQSIECSDSDEDYKQMTNQAYALIALWPVGMPLMFMLILLPGRRDILRGRRTNLFQATAFLHKECTWLLSVP
jgi:hypothetical protein